MAQIIWTRNALSDLTSIAEFIEVDSPKYATITVQNIYKRTELLIDHPHAGRIVPELEQDKIREVIEGNYRIIYEVISNKVYILTVHHSARRLKL